MATLDLSTKGMLHLVLLILLYAGLVTGRQNSQSYCKTESVVEGQPASVTCHFPEDVTVHRHSLNIVRYDFSRGTFVPELILTCFWEQGRNKFNCSAAEGYDFDGRISNTVTVSTGAATKRHAGSYACNYAGEVPSEFNICRLNVKSPKISCTADEVYMGETARLTCHFNTNVNQSKEGFYIKRVRTDSYSGREWDVLTCNWVEQQPDGIFCQTRQGCTLITKSIDNEVTVEIKAVDRSDVGEYSCDTVPHTRGVTTEHCRLIAREKPRSTKKTDDAIPEEKASSATGSGKSLIEFSCVALLALFVWRETRR